MPVADFRRHPLIANGALEDRIDIVRERRRRRNYVAQAIDSGLQQRVVKTNDVEYRRRETRRRLVI